MFTLVVREPGGAPCAGSVIRTLEADPEGAAVLYRAEVEFEMYQAGTCTVSV